MKIRELIKRLEADGWSLVRFRGGHRQLKHQSKPGTVTVAGKPSADIPPGTLANILKQVNKQVLNRRRKYYALYGCN